MAETKLKGDIAEAYVLFLLKQRGFHVLVPWGEDHRFDMVAEKNGIYKKVQVKYVSAKNGILEIPLRSCNNHKVIHYSPLDVDIIAAYHDAARKVYFVPLKNISNRSSFKIRLIPARNNQQEKIVPASRYEARFDFFDK
ncbi:MAG: group I intron-associated PD-(D/E)XK endonuclease [Candidatus Velamenicoccus archaeovorus]